ncbi:low temperature requirement protein A [Kribbella sp. GL6]|uniref:low temperature requirement protein A n=1 Tax=Kribbella sp. GL6 TaxID=3419765 RepID=UPI003CFEAFB4
MADQAEERHASWLELFFDLTVVAAAAQIAHRLHEADTVGQVAACAAMFYAVWSVWTTTSVYANVAGARTRRRAVLRTMLGVGVMAAAVPGVFPGLLPHHGETDLQGRTAAFTVAFIICRGIASRAASRDGQVIAFWPATQTAVAAPFIVSLFTDEPVTYWLWGVGVVLDLVTSVLGARNPRSMEERAKRIKHDLEQGQHRGQWLSRLLRGGSSSEPATPALVTVAQAERGHLDERLGLFVIIVLGEAVAQVVSADTGKPWNGAVVLSSVAAFFLVVILWQLTTLYGFTPAPRSTKPLEPWQALPAHLGVTAAIVSVAAGLGALIPEAEGHLLTRDRWLIFGGLALYLVSSVGAGVAGRAPLRWYAGWAVPSLVAAVLLGVLGQGLQAWLLASLSVVVLGWFALYNWFAKGRTPVSAT